MSFPVRNTIWRSFAIFSFSILICAGMFGASGNRRNADPDQPSAQGDPILARQRWFLRGRTVKGQSAAELRERAVRQRESMVRGLRIKAETRGIIQASSSAIGPIWQPLGPAPLVSDPSGFQSYGNVAGRVTAVTVDQSDSTGNTLYVGGAYGGVWKSTNAATNSVTWQALTDGEATLAVNAIAVSPDGQTVLAGTGEPNNATDSYYGLGILRSTQAGAPGTWTLITGDTRGNTFRGLGFGKIAFNTAVPSQVVAAVSHTAADEGSVQGNSTVGIYYSSDGGASWALASVFDGGSQVAAGSVSDVVYDPSNNTFYASYRYHGFYQSNNGGQTWTRIPNQPDSVDLTTAKCPTASPNTGCALFRGQLAVNPATNELFAWFVDNKDNDKGVWVTRNGGASAWTPLSTSGITTCRDQAGCGTSQGFYDLYLSAVPDNGHTDLYAGAVNLYKSVNEGAFANVTHVYSNAQGCKLNMHPDFHSQDYSHANPAIIYFGNDGGVYRTLNGPALADGCSLPAGTITSLNDNIGSLTQFMSFSQHPTNPGVIIGGTQDNGSPGTSTAGSSTTWADVNLGDGGFNEIDPVTPTNLFTANTDVTIQLCNTATLGDPVCTFQPFNFLVNVDPNGGAVNFPDHGDFYTPYILDPANSGRLIIGTCRVWRGSASNKGNWSASSFANALSNKLDAANAQSGICSSTENYFVSALAAGGAAGAGGSQVIYAGMSEGFDANTGARIGANLWVTTNAAGGAATWVDQTGGINPNHYRISSVAIDPSDTSGQTAYATIMGFSGGAFGHVFKTVNAGAIWADITSNLPDAPADSIVVDPTNSSHLFVGTDVGVFSSIDGGASWIPFGQAFPNVVVNKLRIFNSGGMRTMRASTHGRGMWQVDVRPNYQISVSNSLVTVYANQTATFFGSLYSILGYNNLVTVGCGSGGTAPPATCTSIPGNVTPTGAFSINASAATAQDYNFNIHGVGNDVNSITNNLPVTLRVIDYGVGAVTPAAISTYPNFPNSPTATFNLAPLGQFDQTVFLSCNGLPPEAACNFSPSNAITLSPGVPVNVSVSVSTTQNSLGGSYPVTINALVIGAPAVKTTTFTLTVNDYAVGLNPLSQAIFPGQTTFAGKLTSILNYSSSVTLSCVAGPSLPPAICNFTPNPTANVTPTGAGAPFTVTAGDGSIQDFSFAIQGVGSDPGATLRQQPIMLRVVEFTFALAPGQQTSFSMPKNSVSHPLIFNLTPRGSFNFPVTLSCPSNPAGVTCEFNNNPAPVTVAPSGGLLPVTLTLLTNGTATTGTVTISASSNPARPSGPQTQSLTLTVNNVAGSTDMAVVDNAPEAATVAHAAGAPLTLSLKISNGGGTGVTGANAYVTFSEPIFVQASSIAGGGPCSGTGTVTDSITCTIGLMATSTNQIVSITVVPGFLRSLSAIAVTNSELQDTNPANNTTVITRQVRPRPMAQRCLPVRLP